MRFSRLVSFTFAIYIQTYSTHSPSSWHRSYCCAVVHTRYINNTSSPVSLSSFIQFPSEFIPVFPQFVSFEYYTRVWSVEQSALELKELRITIKSYQHHQ